MHYLLKLMRAKGIAYITCEVYNNNDGLSFTTIVI